MPARVSCPGCALVLSPTGGAPPTGFNASGECFELYGELSAYTLSLADVGFSHQYAVDAYAAQHAGPTSKPITTTFALIGLYLACEHGLSGRAVQRAHQALGRRKREWPRFPGPATVGELTVASVIDAAPGTARNEALRQWASSTWTAWGAQRGRIRDLVAEWLPGPPACFERPDRKR